VRILVTVQLLLMATGLAISQSIDYQDLFGGDWNKASAYEKENRSWIKPMLSKNHISYAVALSVVFPELVRYSALRDKMETGLLKTLYVNLGNEYSDFSIGEFQMKPSFAELIREKAPMALSSGSGIIFKNIADFENIKDFRRSIITDMEDPEIQVNYLIAFIKICEKEFQTAKKDELSQVKFLATAYNYGINRTTAEIENMTDKKYFSIGLIKSQNYSYSDVSLFWYKRFMNGR
jgi:hypothetical protein